MRTFAKHLIYSCIFWVFLALIITLVALQNPVPDEPENLPPETWSYYREQPPSIQYIARHRNEILIVLFILAIGIDTLLFAREYQNRKKR